MLRPVAVVHVPVNDSDLSDIHYRFGAFNSDCDISQKTEAHRRIRQAVVSRRTAKRVGISAISR